MLEFRQLTKIETTQKIMNSTNANLPFCGTEPIGTAELHDFNEGIYSCTENVGGAAFGVSDIALGVGIYSNSDRISYPMGSQRHTRFIVPNGLDLYCVLKLGLLVQHVNKNLPATSCYCPEQTHLQNEDFTYRNDTPVNSFDL
jgi:hypothetical protein